MSAETGNAEAGNTESGNAEAGNAESGAPLNLVVVGHVDHGKSSVIGRLLYDAGALPPDKIEALQAMSARRGVALEYAFLLDALQAERDQGVTIDTTQIQFKTAARAYVIIDAPGHKEFLKNMVSGAALADAAVLVIDATQGMREQSRRHGYLLPLLGVTQVAVVINKMDLANYDEARYDAVRLEVEAYFEELDIIPTAIIPTSARDGVGLWGPAAGSAGSAESGGSAGSAGSADSAKIAWYSGPSLAEALDAFTPPPSRVGRPLRLPVQDVYKFDTRRIIAGRIECGHLKLGDELLFSPIHKTARIASIESWNTKAPVESASAGESVGITLDEQIFVERGHIASMVKDPPMESNIFRARLFWLGRKPLEVGRRLKMKLTTAEYPVEVQSIDTAINIEDLSRSEASKVERNGIAEVTVRARGTVALDEFAASPRTGRFVLIEDYDTVAGGIISMQGHADQSKRHDEVTSQNITSVEHRIDSDARARTNGHQGGVMWLTGLSGAGKSTLAIELERRLFAKGYQVYVLDGDNIRFGLSADLGFAPDDREENIRRVGETAKLFAHAGMLVISAFISPYRVDRDRVRAITPENFHEVYVKADLEICESRDPKGLYAKARRGEIADFTGISAPYEEPERPEILLNTGQLSVEESVSKLVDYVVQNFGAQTLTRPNRDQ